MHLEQVYGNSLQGSMAPVSLMPVKVLYFIKNEILHCATENDQYN